MQNQVDLSESLTERVYTKGNVTIINKDNFPLPMFKALCNPAYTSEGDISATSLINSPRVRILKKYTTYEISATDNLWALFGSSVHHVIERATETEKIQRYIYTSKLIGAQIKKIADKFFGGVVDKALQNPIVQEIESQRQTVINAMKEMDKTQRYISEQRFILDIGGWKLSLTPDLYDKEEQILYDFKTSSVWKCLDKKVETEFLEKPNTRGFYSGTWDWRLQTNIYKRGLELNGFPVKKIVVICICKDWKENDYLKNKTDYPSTPSPSIEQPILSSEFMDKYMEDRVALHKKAEEDYIAGLELPKCNFYEKWSKAPTLKMMNGTNVRSLKNFPILTEQDKIEAYKWYGEKLSQYPLLKVEEHPGENVRCEKYCPMNMNCTQYLSTLTMPK